MEVVRRKLGKRGNICRTQNLMNSFPTGNIVESCDLLEMARYNNLKQRSHSGYCNRFIFLHYDVHKKYNF